jgi:hypothetical protein
MQVADLRLLFRLPEPALEPNVGLNFTTAAMLLNLISGMSVWFFQAPQARRIQRIEKQKKRPESGRRFKAFVRAYWPRVPPEPQSARTVAERLYEIRNSLAHDLGVEDDPTRARNRHFRLAKPDPALSLSDIVDLERSVLHPLQTRVIERRGSTYTVRLAGLYWAAHRMMRGALNDRPAAIERAMAAVTLPAIPEFEDARDIVND